MANAPQYKQPSPARQAPAGQGGGSEIPARRNGTAKSSGGAGQALQKFQALPRAAQAVIVIAVVGFLFLAFNGRGNRQAEPLQNPNLTTSEALLGRSVSNTQVFTGLEADRPALMQSWLEQNRRELSTLNENVEKRFQERDLALTDALQENVELQRQMRQMMEDFTSEIRNIQSESARDREAVNQLAEEQRQMQLDAPTTGVSGQGGISVRRTKIEQTPLGSAGGGPAVDGNQALLAPIGRALTQEGYTRNTLSVASGGLVPAVVVPQPNPFLPPLGFIKGTMLNGVDALVGGQATPALVRLNGRYKTAMNSQVNLDGCFVLVEFQGEISTERAIGKPSRMTCVYPDQGAVTYSVSGYAVDALDGIIGIPGIFYEGDATRIAAAMLADFAAGVAEVIESNQSTVSVDSNGNATKTITGSEAKAEIAGGTERAVGSLRDYLMERVNRVLPFIRLDATREIHLVLLSGVELRAEGSPWTLLFDGEAAKSALPVAIEQQPQL